MTKDPTYPEQNRQPSQEANLDPVSCDASIQELYGYLDGALDQGKAQSIQSHLASCSGCDDVFNFHNHLHSIVGQFGRTEMPEELPNRVFGSILGLSSDQQSLLGNSQDQSPLDPKRGPFEI